MNNQHLFLVIPWKSISLQLENLHHFFLHEYIWTQCFLLFPHWLNHPSVATKSSLPILEVRSFPLILANHSFKAASTPPSYPACLRLQLKFSFNFTLFSISLWFFIIFQSNGWEIFNSVTAFLWLILGKLSKWFKMSIMCLIVKSFPFFFSLLKCLQ